MLLTFLKAVVPLSKTLSYSERDDAFTVSAYPMVRRVTSRETTVTDMLGFCEAIDTAGRTGECLLFGDVDRPLVDESRANHAVKDSLHDWMVFDFDKVDAPPTMDGALAAIAQYLPPECQNAECVIQLSPSCYLPRATKLSAHVFMRLNTPTSIQRLKDFIVWVNFNSPLKDQISLTDSGNTLSFKLDRCVADASRLIYIAPPRTIGFKPTLDKHDALAHFAGEPGFDLPSFTPIPRVEQNEKINDLREQLGLGKRDFRVVKFRDLDVLQDAEEAVISDVRASGDNYLRFNINGGDSLAYWINLKMPEVVGNFKGEPFLFTKQLNPGFYKSLIKATQQMPQQVRGAEGTDILAFYATNRSSALYVGTYDRVNDRLRVDKSTETASFAWLRQFGVPIKPSLPHYDLTHDISSDIRYEEGYPVINLYERTNLMKQYGDVEKLHDPSQCMTQIREHCPVLFKFLNSMAGDPRSAMGFVNWLAFIFQNRIKTGTAWLFWGTEGTGKGLFLQHVVRPLFGESSVGQMMLSNVDKQFNSLLEGKLVVNIDESEMSRTRDKDESMAKLRNWITEPSIVINEKNISEREIPSFVNFIVSANSYRPLRINPGDRRFHVGSRQENRLLPTANEYAILSQGLELPIFARLLGQTQVDEDWVRNPEMTEQKARLFESTHSLLDNVAMALAEGDASFFFEARPSNTALSSGAGNALLPIRMYDDLLRAMHNRTLNVLKHEDLYVLFSVVVSDDKQFPDNATKQKQIFNRYGLSPTGDKRLRCARTGNMAVGVAAPQWQDVPEYLLETIDLKPNNPGENVIPMKKPTK